MVEAKAENPMSQQSESSPPGPGSTPPQSTPQQSGGDTPSQQDSPQSSDTSGGGPSPRIGTQSTAVPILVWRVNNATHALPQILRMAEGAALNVNSGTPVFVGSGTSAGFLIERTAIAAPTAVIAGFTTEASHNLAVNGTAPVGGSGLFFGSVPNQPNARNIAIGSPMADGTLGINVATDETIFVGKTDAAHLVAASDVGATFGLSKDATTGNWFVDTTITTVATGGCCQVVSLVDDLNTIGGRVAFRVVRQFQQLFV